MFGRDARGREDGLELGDVEPEDGHAEGEDDGGEEEQVLGALVEGGRVLKDAQAAVTEGHEAEPLPGRRLAFFFFFGKIQRHAGERVRRT